jgi:O-antigen/teichoic acid export membrane protein
MKKAVYSYGLKVFGLLFSYLTIIVVSRWYSLDQLGVFYIVLNSITIAATVGCLGLPTLMLRYCSRADEASLPPLVFYFIRKYFPWVVLLTGSLAFTLIYIQTELSLSGIQISLIVLAATCFACNLILIEAIRVCRGVYYSETGRNVSRQIFTVLLLTLGFGIIVSLSVAFIINIILSLYLLKTLFYGHSLGTKSYKKNRVDNENQEVFYLILISVFGVIVSSLDILLVGYWGGNSEAGAYGSASRYCLLINFSLLAVNAVIGPKISILAQCEFSNKVLLKDAKSLVSKLRIAVTLMGAILILLLPAYAWIMDIEQTMIDSYFYICLFGYWLAVILGPTGLVLMQAARVKQLLFINLLSIVIALLFGIITYPIYGLVIIPIATMLALNTVKIISIFYIKKSFGIWI